MVLFYLSSCRGTLCAAATSTTSTKLCNKPNSWAALTLTVTDLVRIQHEKALGENMRLWLLFWLFMFTFRVRENKRHFIITFCWRVYWCRMSLALTQHSCHSLWLFYTNQSSDNQPWRHTDENLLKDENVNACDLWILLLVFFSVSVTFKSQRSDQSQ